MQYGPNTPGTCANDVSTGAVAWSNPNNAKLQDGTNATAALTTNSSNYLKVTNFGFAIPTSATIYGIQLKILCSAPGPGGVQLFSARVLQGGILNGADLGTNQVFLTTPSYITVGDAAQLWNITWTPAQINDPTFGFELQAVSGGTDTAQIDSVQCIVYASSPKDLISVARAYQNLTGVTGADQLLQTLITAASDGIRKYCRRDFIAKAYDELYDGNGGRELLLREYPIQSVQSVRYRPVTVLKVINNNTAINQQARVGVTSTGLTLSRVASGVTTTNTLTFSGNVTLQALAAAITALGNGWSGQVVGDTAGDYGLWPSADLYVPTSFGDGTTSQGNLTARGQYAEIKMHTYELAGYQFDPRGWLLRAIPYSDPELLHPEDLVWPPGIRNFRVQYTAGYTTIPEAIQQACAEWVEYLYYETLRNPNITTTSTAPAGGTATSTSYAALDSPPQNVLNLLKPFRRTSISR